MADDQKTTDWQVFDYAAPPTGLCWIEVERPETWCDAGDHGRTVGGYTGQTERRVVLAEVYPTDDGPGFYAIGYGDHGSVRAIEDTARRFLRLVPPELPHAT